MTPATAVGMDAVHDQRDQRDITQGTIGPGITITTNAQSDEGNSDTIGMCIAMSSKIYIDA
jgi:hypothetical protein